MLTLLRIELELSPPSVTPAKHCRILPKGERDNGGGRGRDGRGTAIAAFTVIPAESTGGPSRMDDL
jgi:hypothetical protein